MKKLFSAIVLFCCIYNCSAQTDSTKKITDTTATFDDDRITFTKTEVEATFPGGAAAWKDYLQRNIRYPARAIDKRIEGTVLVQFIVCKDGTLCDIQAVSGPEELRETAVDLIKKTPNWIPATQNGRVVRAYKKQVITFRLRR